MLGVERVALTRLIEEEQDQSWSRNPLLNVYVCISRGTRKLDFALRGVKVAGENVRHDTT